jgi:putative spermidine/putrescine transport system permease protein
MTLSRRAEWLVKALSGMTLAFIYIPLIVIAIYAFNTSKTLEWPPPGFTTKWFSEAINNPGARDAFLRSLVVAGFATAIALVLGTLASFAVARFKFFGRETISFLVILPIALPGIVTGIAFSTTFTEYLDVSLGLMTIIIGHATFCIVVVYNNVVARMRRVSGNLQEASADLGASPLWTFWSITLPNIATALVAGGLLAFGLSFDEIIVTTFTAGSGEETLPLWILRNFSRPNQLPIVDVVALLVILLSIIPVYLAHRLTRDQGGAAPTQGQAVAAEGITAA